MQQIQALQKESTLKKEKASNTGEQLAFILSGYILGRNSSTSNTFRIYNHVFKKTVVGSMHVIVFQPLLMSNILVLHYESPGFQRVCCS